MTDRVDALRNLAPMVGEPTGRMVSAKPLRTRKGSEDLAHTLESLGADREVVEAARKG